MNKKLLIVVLILAAAIGAGVVYVWLQKDTEAPKVSDVATQVETVPSSAQDFAIKGKYVDYTEEEFSSAQNAGKRLLFFHAPWCPQCRALNESIKSSELPDGVAIFKVDYDSNQALRAKYGVTLQTTVVKVDDNGNKLASYVAYDDPTFQSVKQALLP